jgi:hypothetical protein
LILQFGLQVWGQRSMLIDQLLEAEPGAIVIDLLPIDWGHWGVWSGVQKGGVGEGLSGF